MTKRDQFTDEKLGVMVANTDGASDAEMLREAADAYRASQAREISKRERWGAGGAEGMARLCASFPTLRGREGTAPWDVDAFMACMSGVSHGEILAARFVLSVWNPASDWVEVARESGLAHAEAFKRFDLFEALGVWDDEQVKACLRWVELPFWP